MTRLFAVGAVRRCVWLALSAAALVIVGLCSGACTDSADAPQQVLQPQSQSAQQQPATQVRQSQPAQDAQPPAPAREPSDPARLLAAEAEALEVNGYWEQALATRASAIATAGALSDDERTSLRLDNVRLLLRLNLPAEAQAELTVIAPLDLPAELSRRRLLLEAQTALARSDVDTAVSAMSAYVNSDSPAWAVIAVELARALQAAGRGQEAIEWAERALGADLSAQDELRAIHLAATELDIAGESERALVRYDELFLRSPWRDDQALALSRSAALQSERGEFEAARVARMRLVESYPEFELAWQALDQLLADGVDVNQLHVGLVRIEQQRWADARSAMLNLLGSTNVLAEQVAGEYYIAVIHDAQGDADSAVLGYRAVIARDPSDPLAAQSAMRLAEDALAGADASAADAYWRQVLARHLDHPRAPEAGWRLGIAVAARGEWQAAAERFSEAADVGANVWSDQDRQRFQYWSALMHRLADDEEQAAARAEAVVEIQPVSYWALRARDLISSDIPATLEIPTREWLARLTGDTAPDPANLARSTGWLAARDLRLGGFDDAADRMLSHWLSELGDPWVLAQAAEFLAAQGEVRASASAATAVIDWFELNWSEAPLELVRLAYPQPWADVMALHANAEGVDPLLLWSLIRRESFYDADAEGLAGEIGLTQVIPLTGSDIARGLGIEYEHPDLARPALAIQFGAWYLARQLEGFSNEPVMALAAYNAGPGNAARWEDEALIAGPDGFLAALDFPSTQRYVRYVIEAWAAYRAIAAADR